MKKYMLRIFYLLILLVLPGIGFAQIQINGSASATILNENSFLDASTNFNDRVNVGKGLIFPRTDLCSFTFKTGSLDEINFPTAFDGMIIYNTTTGNTLPGQGVVTAVTPGFYYFSNPTGTTSIDAGKWLKLSDNTTITSDEGTGPIVENGTELATGGQIYDFTLQHIADSIQSIKPLLFEKELADNENSIDIGFALNTNTLVLYNGQAILKNQWSGVGTTVIHLNLVARLYDNIIIKR